MNIVNYIKRGVLDCANVFLQECKNVVKDSGVVLIFFVASLAYPLLYNYVYYNESVKDIRVAVIDNDCSSYSRQFIKKLEATKEIEVVNCINMDLAKSLMVKRDVHAILEIPNNYSSNIVAKEQSHIPLYINMSCFLVYKSVALAVNQVMLDETNELKKSLLKPIPYNEVFLFNPGGGFSSFFLPALLIIIIHQTIFFGIGMVSGTLREERRRSGMIKVGRGVFRVVMGRSAAYFLMYALISTYILVLIPRIFNLPHLGNVWDIYRFLLPFLLSTIFFSQTAAVLVKNRETGMVMFLFFSIILLFLSGFSWPFYDMPAVWRYISYIFPSTFGVESYIKINSMGASISQVQPEYFGLWIQAGIYFLTAYFAERYFIRKESV